MQYTRKDIFLKADKGRLAQVITNLLSNAVKFTDNGVITIDTDESDNEVIVSIRDTGSGIDPEIIPKLFQNLLPNPIGARV